MQMLFFSAMSAIVQSSMSATPFWSDKKAVPKKQVPANIVAARESVEMLGEGRYIPWSIVKKNLSASGIPETSTWIIYRQKETFIICSRLNLSFIVGR